MARVARWVGLVVAGCALGWMGATSPTGLVAGLVGLVLAVAIWLRPGLGALLLIVLVLVIPGSALRSAAVSPLGGGIEPTDALLALSMLAWLATRIVTRRTTLLPSSVQVFLLTSFLLLAGGSLATAHSNGVPVKEALGDLRPLLAYVTVFMLVDVVRTPETLRLCVHVVLATLALSTCITLVRYIAGDVEPTLDAAGVYRIRDTVDLAPLLAWVSAIALIPFTRSVRDRTLLTLLAVLGLAGLYVTFLRGAWLAAIVGLAVVLALVPARLRRGVAVRVVIVGCAATVAVVGVGALAGPGVSTAGGGIARIATLVRGAHDLSSRHRLAEWSEARREIAAHPLTGIGAGATITFVSPMYDAAEEASLVHVTTSYIHNSYLWLALKLGIAAAAMLVAAFGYALYSSLSLYRASGSPERRGLLLAATASFAAVMVFAVTGPHVTAVSATPVVAALIAVPEILRRLPSKPGTTHGGNV